MHKIHAHLSVLNYKFTSAPPLNGYRSAAGLCWGGTGKIVEIDETALADTSTIASGCAMQRGCLQVSSGRRGEGPFLQLSPTVPLIHCLLSSRGRSHMAPLSLVTAGQPTFILVMGVHASHNNSQHRLRRCTYCSNTSTTEATWKYMKVSVSAYNCRAYYIFYLVGNMFKACSHAPKLTPSPCSSMLSEVWTGQSTLAL